MKWVFLIIAILAEVVGTAALKESDGFTRLLPTLIVFLGYGIAFYFLSLTIKEMNLGVVYAIWSGAGIFLITLVGYFRFNQALDTPAIIGISLIVAGVIIMNLFSKTVTH